jgi:hypothetical protein
MKYALIPVSDDFEKGDCYNCPISYWEESIDTRLCSICGRFDECPLEIKEVRNEVDN